MQILLGTDPEVFIRDLSTGEYVSADGIIPGTKDKPYKVDRGAVQRDGVAAEFNIDPAKDEDEFNFNIERVLDQLSGMVKSASENYELAFVPYAEFDADYFKGLQAHTKILGCDPDYNIAGEVNPNPSDFIEDKPIRSAAGHIHIGFTHGAEANSPLHFADCVAVSRFFHEKGVFAPTTELEKKRLTLYGDNGSFRAKPYGVELRAPSNLWVACEETRREMYRKVMGTMKELMGAQ